MDNAWKDKLRERFSDYSAPEPEGLWEGIEQGLSGKKRSKILPIWWMSGGLAAAAAVALVVLLPGSRREALEPLRGDAVVYVEQADASATDPVEETADTSANTAALRVPGAITTTPSGSKTTSSSPKESTPFGIVSRQTLLADASVVKQDTVRTIDGMKTSIPTTISAEVKLDKPVREEDVEKMIQSVVDEAVKQMKASDAARVEEVTAGYDAIDNAEKMELRKRYFIGAYREGGQSAFEESRGYGMAQTGRLLTRSSGGDDATAGDIVRMLSANRASTYEAHHGAPVRVGVKASVPLTNHLSLVSGLNWTSLSSEFEESTASTRNVIQQNLGYLGVPLQLEASFKPWKKLWLYAGAGGMVEKGLLATSKNFSYIDDLQKDVQVTHPDAGGLLWSVGASAGAEYRFGSNFGVYLAPGLEYHFDNGSEVRSAYTEKPIHWNIDLGVRFHFGN